MKTESKRLLVYNIRYAAGSGPAFHLPVPGAGYLRSNRKNLARITEFIRDADADIVGLIEVDTGSIRSGVNQAEAIAEAIGHYSTYQCKYGEGSLNNHVPILRNQSNAFLAAPRVHGERFHYFDTGIKRLIIELELDDVAVFLVHLSLKYRHRHYQLRHLYQLVKKCTKPVIVAGDFNTFWGEHEIFLFMEAAGLRSANEASLPSYPARTPRKELDFVLYGKGIEMTGFEIPEVTYSDHLPLVFDFDIAAEAGDQSVDFPEELPEQKQNSK
ncbi:MAG: endonuclease/exonuclease/phosphatase family protein [Pseudomonadota bacterium]